jgi:hypothetical protein
MYRLAQANESPVRLYVSLTDVRDDYADHTCGWYSTEVAANAAAEEELNRLHALGYEDAYLY